MTWLIRILALTTLLLASAGPAWPTPGSPAKPSPAKYRTGNYGLTFAVPARSYYCPLPDDWIGSDHGTVLFLEQPSSCGGTGYASNGRGYVPNNLATIGVYYGYYLSEIEHSPTPCKQMGKVSLFGQNRAVCESHEGGVIVRTITARYLADADAEVIFTLTTRPERLKRDMATLASIAASLSTCKTLFKLDNGTEYTTGQGKPCPEDASWF